MKKINNYWVDENNNRWSTSSHTKKQAQEKSESLINCRDCSDCCNLAFARHGLAGSGTQTAGLCMGGYANAASAVAEKSEPTNKGR